jgi:hypothetical protein
VWQKWEDRLPTIGKWVRDILLFAAGLRVLHHEVFEVPTAELYVLGIVAALLGLPFFLRSDQRSRKDDK